MQQSPMMRQFHAVKKEHPEGLLFFRMGDFFELFYGDAEKAAELLGLTLTARSKGESAIPMAGVPVRSAEGYINRLIKLGEKVVVCDQVQDPSEAKGIVERAVTRVVTPGTVVEEDSLDEARFNFLVAIAPGEHAHGLAWADLSTGAFFVEETPPDELLDAVSGLDAAELLVPEPAVEEGGALAAPLAALDVARTLLPDWHFDVDAGRRRLEERLGVKKLDGFGLAGASSLLGAAGALLDYLETTQRGALAHLRPPRRRARGDRMVLDRTTRTSLELVRTQRDGGRKGSLIWVLDKTRTPMGARLLSSWLTAPLLDVAAVSERQDAVRELVEENDRRGDLRLALRAVRDVERLLSRVAVGRASARELVGLRESLAMLPAVRQTLDGVWSTRLTTLEAEVPDLSALVTRLAEGLEDEPPLTVKEGGMIRAGFHAELDELRTLGSQSRDWIAAYQASEQERSGIPSLKVGFNKVFGYYIEITHAHKDRVPADYHRKQTLKNAERYVTPELKEYEEKALGAEERIRKIEYELFLQLREEVSRQLPLIQTASDLLAELDVYQSLAEVAAAEGWVRPEVDDSRDMEVVAGRHPVLERMLEDATFVPNDVRFEADKRELVLITGPNMAGKSTYIRQTALLAILAQVGSYVPAERARIGLVDRVFTRVGASDELARGNSTFMVEMIETAEILNGATDRSLVVLDEVGRGTSTFDGLALAWAIIEHLVHRVKCRALFATHYHQLLDLADRLPTAANMSVAVREWQEEIVFLHEVVEGGTDRSYGIHVARLAGLPKPVLDRAGQVLEDIESETPREPAMPAPEPERQLGLFAVEDEKLRKEVEEIDLMNTTPLQALQILERLKGLL